MKYVLKIETDNLDVYKHICKVLGVNVQENLMKLGNEKSVFKQEIFITKRKNPNDKICQNLQNQNRK
jgi:hypothetical protein|nr:MAG TPA: hypothetical protein [Caudoviricetes sp.]